MRSRICAVTSGNVVIEGAVMHVRQSISEGKNMAEPLTETKVFPDMVVQMIAVGEQTVRSIRCSTRLPTSTKKRRTWPSAR